MAEFAKYTRIRIEIVILLIAMSLNVFAYAFVELTVHFLVSDFSIYHRYIVALFAGLIVIYTGNMISKRIKNSFQMNLEHEYGNANPLSGITFLWWMPITLVSSAIIFQLLLKFSGLEIVETPVGRFIMLYVTFVALELRKLYFISFGCGEKS